jgi:hypothetical protein
MKLLTLIDKFATPDLYGSVTVTKGLTNEQFRRFLEDSNIVEWPIKF